MLIIFEFEFLANNQCFVLYTDVSPLNAQYKLYAVKCRLTVRHVDQPLTNGIRFSRVVNLTPLSGTLWPTVWSTNHSIGPASLARENEAGAVGGSWSIYSMLTYRTLFCFGRNNRTVPK